MKIIIIGSSGFSKVVIDIVEAEGQHEIVGLIDRFRKVGENTLGYRILGGEADLPKIIMEMEVQGALIAIGDNTTRKTVYDHIRQLCPGLVFPVTVHPSAQLARSVELGPGSVVAALANLHNGVAVGMFGIINGISHLGHDVQAGDFVSIGPNAAVAGDVRIGDLSVVAIGSHVLEKCKVGCNSIIGAGSLVTKDVEENVVVYGVPAKTIKVRVFGEKYYT